MRRMGLIGVLLHEGCDLWQPFSPQEFTVRADSSPVDNQQHVGHGSQNGRGSFALRQEHPPRMGQLYNVRGVRRKR